ncbi:MAG: shikimate kinase [Acidimicrobiia bacterium]
MPLWLIGMMGSGKTEVGRLAAKRLGARFADTDLEVEEAAGCSVRELWERRGETAFRELEAQAVARVAGSGPAVVATGGGVVLREENIERMRAGGPVVWLEASVDALAGRMADDQQRPLLMDRPAGPRLAAILDARRDAYARAAHHRVTTDDRSPERVAEDVVRLWTGS